MHHKSLFIALSLFLFSNLSFAQNTWGPITRPISKVLADLAPNSVNFENNLMNHISDELRVDDSSIRKDISCFGDANGIIDHHKGGRHVRVRCENQYELTYARKMVSNFYSPKIGNHLKYAFKSGPYIFALCDYDGHGNHDHSRKHYVCRVPVDGASKEAGMETFCYNMGYFHRTCNPHKALVAAEILPINSMMRWESIDKTILARFIGKHKGTGVESLKLINDIVKGRIKYNTKRRGAATTNSRYPKFFIGKRDYACFEYVLRRSSRYVETQIDCADLTEVPYNQRGKLSSQTVIDNSIFSRTMKRLKQDSVYYPMLGRMKSSVD